MDEKLKLRIVERMAKNSLFCKKTYLFYNALFCLLLASKAIIFNGWFVFGFSVLSLACAYMDAYYLHLERFIRGVNKGVFHAFFNFSIVPFYLVPMAFIDMLY